MTCIKISMGIMLITVTMIFAAFLILGAVVSIIRTVHREKDRRASQSLQNLREELRREKLAHDDDLK